MGGGKGYPKTDLEGRCVIKSGAVTIVDARGLFKFDLSQLKQLDPSEIVKAEWVYNMLDVGEGHGALYPPPPAGIPMHGFIYPLNTTSYEYEELGKERPLHHPGEESYNPWNETDLRPWPDYGGYVCWKNKPGYVPGAPMYLAVHDKGPNSQGRIDITEIVKGWVSGAYPNNGIELKDHDDRSCPVSSVGDGYTWYIASQEDRVRYSVLEVEVDADRVKIKDKPSAMYALSFYEEIDLEA
jgi:hypothetical protein